MSLREARPGDAGSRFLAEIREQPAALLRLLEHAPEFARVAATMHARDARLVRNNEPVNLEMLIVGELRVLAGISRRAQS